ncbi:MAG: hypothetical protein AAB618_03550 [Patescibacteria group bacterium]
MFRLFAIVLIFGLTLTSVQAQSDSSSFLVRVFGGDDTSAPSTPTLSGTAIATTQIDLTWTTATDNFAVSGYVLFRNGTAIATTTQITYSDVGLIASTSYSYYVQAFDPALNYSSSSNVVIVTTLDNPPTPTTSNSNSGGTATRVLLNNLSIEPSEHSALFSINTVRPARFEVRWGRTGSYELGYTVNDVYVSSYKTTLNDLEPGTIYQYEVIGYTPFRAPTVLERGQFSTVSLTDAFPPTNVSTFVAERNSSDVKLSWVVPTEADIASVRIVRSHLHFPSHSQDGVVVYQGLGNTATDENILEQYSPVYYTAFVVDNMGNVSSGAVARVYAVSDNAGDTPVLNPPIPSGTNDDGQEETVASTSSSVPVGTRMPSLEEIFLQQRETRQSLGEQGVVLDSEVPFLLSIPKNAISDNLKTIIVSLTDPTDSRLTYSFMLRINKDQTAYEAVLPPTRLEGKSRLIIDIYDYESLIVANYQKTIEFKKSESVVETPIFPDKIVKSVVDYGWMLAIPLLFFMIIFLIYNRRRSSLEDNL